MNKTIKYSIIAIIIIIILIIAGYNINKISKHETKVEYKLSEFESEKRYINELLQLTKEMSLSTSSNLQILKYGTCQEGKNSYHEAYYAYQIYNNITPSKKFEESYKLFNQAFEKRSNAIYLLAEYTCTDNLDEKLEYLRKFNILTPISTELIEKGTIQMEKDFYG